MKWQEFLRKRLFEPAGMTRTTALASEMYGAKEHADPLQRIDGKWQRSALVKTDRTMHAAGGIGTTARDAARWLILNIDRGEIDGKRILPEEMAREYYAKASDLPQPRGRIRIEEGFALGWGVGKYRDPSRSYYFHQGGYVGAASYFCFLPDERIGVAVLANSDGGAGAVTIVSIDLLDRLLGIEDQLDLLPAYQEDAKELRAAVAARPSGVNPMRVSGGLSRPAAAYAGTYSNVVEGELEVALDAQGELAAHIGDLPFTPLARRGTSSRPTSCPAWRTRVASSWMPTGAWPPSCSIPTRVRRYARVATR